MAEGRGQLAIGRKRQTRGQLVEKQKAESSVGRKQRAEGSWKKGRNKKTKKPSEGQLGVKGFLGIEVKYAESLNDKPASFKELYRTIAIVELPSIVN